MKAGATTDVRADSARCPRTARTRTTRAPGVAPPQVATANALASPLPMVSRGAAAHAKQRASFVLPSDP